MGIGTMLKLRSYSKKVREWPESKGCTLEIALTPPDVNGLKFRSHIDEARRLGRPSDVTVVGSGSAVRLVFSTQGISLEYENDRLVYVGIVISPKDDVSSDSSMSAARAILLHGAPFTLSPEITVQRIVEMIGQPADVDSDKEEHVLTHEIDGYKIESEFTLQNTLKRLNMYPT